MLWEQIPPDNHFTQMLRALLRKADVFSFTLIRKPSPSAIIVAFFVAAIDNFAQSCYN